MRSAFGEDQRSVGILSGKVSRGCRFWSRSELMAPIWSSFKKYHHILFQNFFNSDVPSLAMKPLQSYAGTQWKGFSQRFAVSRHCFCFPKFLLKKCFTNVPFSYRGNLRMYRLMSNKKKQLSPPRPAPLKLEDTRRTDLPEHEPRRVLPPGDGHSWCYILIHTADSYVCFHFPCGYCVAYCERELFLSSTHLPLSTTSVFLFFFFDAMSLLLLNDATPRCFILQCPPPRHRYRCPNPSAPPHL